MQSDLQRSVASCTYSSHGRGLPPVLAPCVGKPSSYARDFGGRPLRVSPDFSRLPGVPRGRLQESSSSERLDLHFDHCWKLQVLLSQYYEEVLGCKSASEVATPRELKFHWSIEPPSPAPSSGDDRCNGDVRPQRWQSLARVAEEGAGEGAAEALPLRGHAAGEDGQPWKGQMNSLSLNERFVCAHNSS